MGVFSAGNLDELLGFESSSDQLAIFTRPTPQAAAAFFHKLMQVPFSVVAKIRNDSASEDVRSILQDNITKEIQADPFYDYWLNDMATICKVFCKIQNSNAVGFWLGSDRGCRRYHIDNVPLRLLVTYAGEGTEWLPDEAADRNAYLNGEPNEKIVLDKSALQFLSEWDVAVFRGGIKGLLHRTPDSALSSPSILMRLDHESFWDTFLKNKNVEYKL